MLRVLVVDDEPIVSAAIAEYLRNSRLDIQFVESALNGFEALDYLRLDAYDLVLTDIQMGGMSGIELMEAIFVEQPGLPVIVISAYDEFEYARHALRLGAKDYIVKPVQLDHLEEVVERVIKEKASKLQMFENRSSDEVREHEERQALRNGLLTDLVSEYRMTENDITSILSKLNITLQGPQFGVVVIDLNLRRGGIYDEELISLRDRKLVKYAAFNIIEEIAAEWQPILFYGNGDQLVALLQSEANETLVHLLCQSIHQNLLHYLHIPSAFGVGRFRTVTSELGVMYREACDLLKWKSMHPDNYVFFFGDMYRNVVSSADWQVQVDELANMMQMEPVTLVVDQAVQSFLLKIEGWLQQEESDRSIVLLISYRLFGLLMEYATELQQKLKDYDPITYYKHVQASPSVSLGSYVMEVQRLLRSCRVERDQSLIHHVLKYIQGNFRSKELKLQEIAAAVYLSPSYLSYLFTKLREQNLWTYVTDIRMEEAKRLLMHSDKKRYEIADEVGYESPEHFSRVFKRKFGISPAEFRASSPSDIRL